jgi:hypothetical protein
MVALSVGALTAWGLFRSSTQPQSAPHPMPPAPTTAALPPVTIEPPVLHMGEVDPMTNTQVQFTLRNNTDQPITLERVVSDCSCAVPEWDSDPIAASATTVITVAIDTGKKQGVHWTKRITALVADRDPVNASIDADVREYMRIEPATIDAPADDAASPDTALQVTSTDGSSFTVIASPDGITGSSPTAASEHAVQVDWAKWRAADRPRSIEVVTSHPKAPPLAVTVRRK